MQRHLIGLTPLAHHDDHEVHFDLNRLLKPASVFAHPLEVLNDGDLTLSEKRAILASWASDACAVEAAPALRKSPSGRAVEFDDIIDALQTLDKEVSATHASRGRSKTTWRRPTFRRGGNDRSDQGSPLH